MEEPSNLLHTTNIYDNVLALDKQQCGSSIPIDFEEDDTIPQPTAKSWDASALLHNVKVELYWDKSNANRVAMLKPGEDAHDKERICAFLEQIRLHKINKYPSGLISKKGQEKMRLSAGMYTEGKDFEVVGILGLGGIADKVMVINDKKTGELIAQKRVQLSHVRPEEIMALMELEKTGYPPEWLLFQFETNSMAMYMDIVSHAIRLDVIIDNYISKMDPRNRKALSLCVFDSLLAAIYAMTANNWVHGDLHGGNVMIQRLPASITIKLLDFGKAELFNKPQGHHIFKQDIIQAMRHFSGLYIGDNFEDQYQLQRIFISPQKKILWINQIPLEGKEKDDFISVMENSIQINDAVDIEPVRRLVQTQIDQETFPELMKQSIEVLFPNKDPVSLSPHFLQSKNRLLESMESSETKQRRTSLSKSLNNRKNNFNGESEVTTSVDENAGTDNQICTSKMCALKIADLQATVKRQEQELSLMKSNNNQSVEVDKLQGVPRNPHHTKQYVRSKSF